ncbi:hypothetical protein [Acinetobacter modestus]|uniref:hypothetical protein n=1 Tax=Acinetobacter modestus TaxID=1776740 RepID=UPI00301ABA35
MKYIRISLFFVAAILISSCSYVGEINVYGNLNQGVFFKVIPSNESFLSLFKIYQIDVTTEKRKNLGLVENVWSITSDGQKIDEFKYGFLPKGFSENRKAHNLNVDTIYTVSIDGSMTLGPFSAMSCFYIDENKIARIISC